MQTQSSTVWRLTETEVNSSTYQEQVRDRGVPQSYPDEWLELRWIRPGQTSLIPLQCKGEKKEKGEVLHLFRCYTHTPGRDRVNPERQEEEKSGHKRRAKAGTAQGGGGEQTDLQNQPTRRNGLDKHRARTWNPQRVTEGHGGRIRDRMGD